MELCNKTCSHNSRGGSWKRTPFGVDSLAQHSIELQLTESKRLLDHHHHHHHQESIIGDKKWQFLITNDAFLMVCYSKCHFIIQSPMMTCEKFEQNDFESASSTVSDLLRLDSPEFANKHPA